MRRYKALFMATALVALVAGLAFAGNKSPMFGRQIPGGPVVVVDDTQTTGNIWFVDSATGTNAAGYGLNPDAPVATIDYAIGLCTASQGDWIVVMPGHTESLASGTALAADVSGIRIIGIGTGRNRPVLSWTASAAEIGVTAYDVQFKNLVFNMGRTGGVVQGIKMYATSKDVQFTNCDFVIPSVNTVISMTGGTRTQIEDCKFYGSTETATGVTTGVIAIGNSVNDVTIKDCTISAYVLTQNGAMISAADSRISGFVLEGSNLRSENSGASCWSFNTSGTASGGIFRQNACSYGASGVSSFLFWDVAAFPPYDTGK
ncbi:MAG: hypothetical protein ABIJ57_10835 [Pseudomonadota bacterium]